MEALPQHTFAGKVISVGQLPSDSGPLVRYPVRASVGNGDGLLNLQMAAHARVLTTGEHYGSHAAATRALAATVVVENMGLKSGFLVLALVQACGGRSGPRAEGPATETGSVAGAADASMPRPTRQRCGFRSSLPSQLYVEHDATIYARSRGVVESIRQTSGAGSPPASLWPGWRAPTSASPWPRPKRGSPIPSSRWSDSGH